MLLFIYKADVYFRYHIIEGKLRRIIVFDNSNNIIHYTPELRTLYSVYYYYTINFVGYERIFYLTAEYGDVLGKRPYLSRDALIGVWLPRPNKS